MRIAKLFTIFFILSASIYGQIYSSTISPFPNQLKGYEFWDNGKLKGLKLGISSKADVKKSLGESCEYQCDYDEDWTLHFNYLDEDKFREVENQILIPRKEYFGLLYSVALMPKKKVSFRRVRFSKQFTFGISRVEHCSTSEYDCVCHWEKDKVYGDSYGLSYSISEKNSKKTFVKGNLSAIIYSFPDELELKMFTSKNE